MAKILKDIEMADIILRAVHGNEIDCADVYSQFLEDLGDLISAYFGSARGCVSAPDFPGDELDWACGFHINESVPDNGGVFARYDKDVVWQDGKEVP